MLRESAAHKSAFSPRIRLLGRIVLISFGLLAAWTGWSVPAQAACTPTGQQCRIDLDCCPGLLCGWGRTCQPGCRIGGTFYRRGTVRPDSDCQICRPEASTRSWTNLAAGTSCGELFNGECDRPDTCDSAGRCVNNVVPAGTTCSDDRNRCTIDQCDGRGFCGHPAGNAGELCRPAVTECDAAERCTGTSPDCPDDASLPAGTACGDDGRPCTADQCDGRGVCRHPAGNTGELCRPAIAECDAPDRCNGTSSDCPVDAALPDGTPCGDDGRPCTADQCDGRSIECTHPAGNAGTTCRAGSGDVCDPAERCDGSSPDCPPDVVQPDTLTCRAETGSCDAPERCTGVAGAGCPPDAQAPDGTTCDAGTDATRARICDGGSCGDCCPDPSAGIRLLDNRDGTITDLWTCLVWEKKDGADGRMDYGNPHDVDNTYGWSAGAREIGSPLLSDFLTDLNTSRFARHGDWRIPSSAGCCGLPTGKPAELESILLSGCPAGGPCIRPEFGPTASAPYWSSASSSGLPWFVSFADGSLGRGEPESTRYVRGVRGAVPCGDGIVDCGESDVDCGGTCGPCADGKQCRSGSDCRSGVCGPNGVCLAPSCADRVKNGSETDVDCGGSCPGCGSGSHCQVDDDCSNGTCDPVTRTCGSCAGQGAGPCADDASCCSGLQCSANSSTCVACLGAGDRFCGTSAECCSGLKCASLGPTRFTCKTCFGRGDGFCRYTSECCRGFTCNATRHTCE